MGNKKRKRYDRNPSGSGSGEADRSSPPISKMFAGPAVWAAAPVIAAVLWIYAPVWNHSYVAWDDPEYVSENAQVTAGLTAEGIRWAFTTGHMGNWHPLTWLSYMAVVQAFGAAARAQLAANVVLHAVSVLLLFAVLWRMTRAPGRSAFVAAVFAVHPLHVESVAWVSERKDVLSLLLGLLALWAYVDYAQKPRRGIYWAVLALFTSSLMAKPMLVTLPAVMLLLDYWPLGR